MGRPPDPWKSVPHSDFWKKVKDLHNNKPWIRLRPAANLVGMFRFPYGWLATEYRAIIDEDICDFESNWRDGFKVGVLTRSPFGEKAAKRASEFRSRSVEEYLKKSLARRLIGYDPLYTYNPKAPAYGKKPYSYPLSPSEFGYINVELSTVGRLVSRQHAIHVDVLDLLNCLIADQETRGVPAKINREEAERIARRFIETWQPTAPSNVTKSAIIETVVDPEVGLTVFPDGAVANNGQVQPIIDKLWLEYGLGEKNSIISGKTSTFGAV